MPPSAIALLSELGWQDPTRGVYQAAMIKDFFRRSGNQGGNLPLFQLNGLARDRRPASEAHIRSLCTSVYVGDRTVLTRVLGRYKMYLDADDVGLSGHVMLDGYWEMWLTEALAQAAKPGLVAADVGANLGYFTVLLSALVGESGHVHAFEPNPPIAARLRRTLALNGFENATTLHEQALGADDSAAILTVPSGEPKNAHLVSAGGELAAGQHALTLRRLDSYPELADLGLIKIDAEGAERSIWEGMSGILERGRPMTVFMEFTPARYDDPVAFLDEILRWGFAIERLDLAKGVAPCTIDDVLAAPPREDQMLCFSR